MFLKKQMTSVHLCTSPSAENLIKKEEYYVWKKELLIHISFRQFKYILDI